MKYSDITINDPNIVKRFLQRRRYQTALDLYPKNGRPKQILDFGGGDGELCLQLARVDKRSRFICYEPAPQMREQARGKIENSKHIELVDSSSLVPDDSCDVVYSLEVFEHLPANEFRFALEEIFRLLKPGGHLVVGVPNELYFAALYKGAFRLTRRIGDYDARMMNIIRCALGNPPKDRPVGQVATGKAYHFHHLGFDHRILGEEIAAKAGRVNKVFSPFWILGAIASPEIYYVSSKP